MAKGDWWFKLEWDDWLSDERLSICSFETQGFWMRCVCLMHRSGQFQLTGTIEELRRLIGCLPEELVKCATELKRTGAADVILGNSDVTIVSRRLQREHKAKEENRLAVARHRVKDECKDNVMSVSPDRVKSKSKSKKEKKKRVAANAAVSDHKKGMSILQKVIGKYPDGGGQGKALKWMLAEGATLEQIERELKLQHAEYSAKGMRASYLTLQKTIFLPKAPPDILSPDYPCSAHLPFSVGMSVTSMSWEDYQKTRDQWRLDHPEHTDEVDEYERSRDFRERYGEEIAKLDRTSPAPSRSNGNGSQENAMPVPR